MPRRRPCLRALVLAAALSGARAGKLSCGHCIAIQEGIYRSIRHNVSAVERSTHAGLDIKKTIEIGQIIWHLCDSDAWTMQRHSSELVTSCREHVRPQVDTMTNHWKGHNAETYKDSVRAHGRTMRPQGSRTPDGLTASLITFTGRHSRCA